MRLYYRPGHPKASKNGFVKAEDLTDLPIQEARFAPILTDRFYENTAALDGTDIGSRRKFRDYLKANNYTHASDFTQEWDRAAKERERVRDGSGDFDHKSRREDIARATYQRLKP